MQRKTELDAMLGDSQRYEAKRNEVEVWLARMETRLEKMRAVGHTADVLEAQLREQKVYIYISLSLIFLPPFSKPCLLSILTRRVAGNRPLLLEDRPLCLFFVPRRWTEDGLIAAIRVD